MTAARDAAEHGRMSAMHWHRTQAESAREHARAASAAAVPHYLALAAWHTTRAVGYERAIMDGRGE